MKTHGVSIGGRVAALSVGLMATAAVATVTHTKLFGDSYIVTDGSKTYSVLDVYIECGNSADILSSVFGVSAYVATFTMNQGEAFQQSNGTAASSWLPNNNDGRAWDSYVTCGARVQGSDISLAGGKAGFLSLQLDTNWSGSSSGELIVGQGAGAGWYPAVGGSNTTTNPYCRGGYNGGTASTPGYWNTAKCTTAIAGNGITPGQSLSNYWMVGRFSIDITSTRSGATRTMTMKFASTGKQNGTTTFTGSSSTAGRFNSLLTFDTQNGVPCISDVDLSGTVDFADVALLLIDFGPCSGCPSDLDGSGTTDTADVGLLLLDFGVCPS